MQFTPDRYQTGTESSTGYASLLDSKWIHASLAVNSKNLHKTDRPGPAIQLSHNYRGQPAFSVRSRKRPWQCLMSPSFAAFSSSTGRAFLKLVNLSKKDGPNSNILQNCCWLSRAITSIYNNVVPLCMTTQELSANRTTRQSQMPVEWASFVHDIVTQLTQENVALTYDLNNVKIAVPSSSGERGSETAQWVIDGSITVRGIRS